MHCIAGYLLRNVAPVILLNSSKRTKYLSLGEIGSLSRGSSLNIHIAVVVLCCHQCHGIQTYIVDMMIVLQFGYACDCLTRFSSVI